MPQRIVEGSIAEGALEKELDRLNLRRALLVHDSSLDFLPYAAQVRELPQIAVGFTDFAPNPAYESVQGGVAAFRRSDCDGIVAIGGGSAMDVAKCIKLFCRMDEGACHLWQPFSDTGVPLLAVPTTAGTGSESTHFAVVYLGSVKQSVAHESIRPDVALLDASALKTLPIYQKKCTLLDALCQAIESWWSVNSTAESRELSRQALTLLMESMDAYLAGDGAAASAMLRAANLAGQAIDWAQTTAPHAMSYQLTKMLSLPHGHAVATCLPGVWRYIAAHMESCTDARGAAHLRNVLTDIAAAMGERSPKDAIARFEALLRQMELARPEPDAAQLRALVGSVNQERLKNNPVPLAEEALAAIYAGKEEAL